MEDIGIEEDVVLLMEGLEFVPWGSEMDDDDHLPIYRRWTMSS